MPYIIKNVPSYQVWGNPWKREGVVINWYTGEQRLFPTKAAAKSYADLSKFRNHQIEAVRA